MKNLCIFIIGCLFVATLSGCLYVEPGYGSSGYYNSNMALADARFNTINTLLYSANQNYYAPPAQVFTVRRSDPCDGLTPFQCVGFDINKNVRDGRAGFGNQNHHSNNGNYHHGGRHSNDDNGHRGDDHGRRGR